VREGPLQPLGGGVVKWTRTYSKIPQSRRVFESFAWFVPGIGEQVTHPQVNINSAVNGSGTTTLALSDDPGADVGDVVQIVYRVTDQSGVFNLRTTSRTALAGTSGSSVVVALIQEPSGTITFQTLRKIEPGRNPFSHQVSSSLQIDYFLPGVSSGIASPFEIPIFEPIEILDGDGRVTQSFTASTSPTTAEWRTRVSNGDQVVAERSIIRQFMGNIYERTTRYVRAI